MEQWYSDTEKLHGPIKMFIRNLVRAYCKDGCQRYGHGQHMIVAARPRSHSSAQSYSTTLALNFAPKSS